MPKTLHYGPIVKKRAKVHILLNFDRNLINVFGTGEKLHKASGKTFSVKNVVLMDEKHEGADW